MGAAVTAVPQTFSDIENLYCGTVYPRLGKEHKTALCLFCAEWYGMQDAYWLARAGLVGTCVDIQGDKLAAMGEVYPENWEFIEADVYEFAEGTERTWDVVTLDPWTSHFSRCAELLPLWCSLADKTVVLGHGYYRLLDPEAPEGWEMTEKIKRSDYKGGVNWLVFTRA